MKNNLEILDETLNICKSGYYDHENKRKSLTFSLEDMEETVVLLPEDIDRFLSKDLNRPFVIGRCGYTCKNIDSFSSAQKMYDDHSYSFSSQSKPILVLNFANPIHPGGGVRRGARAQEEDLCRKSSLLLSLESEAATKYYNYNRSLNTFMGSDAMIITPNVEVIRDSKGDLLEKSFQVSVLTCAAPMITYGLEGMSQSEYEGMFYGRIVKMLKIAAYYEYDHLVLGAWGCGAFRNDAAVVSDLFYKALKELKIGRLREKDLFRIIQFAVLDRTPDRYNFNEFDRNFGSDRFYRDENQRAIDEANDRIRETEKHLDKIKGSLFGGAIGDALGYPVEFLREEEIFRKYGKDGIQRYEIDPGTGKALISDDTQMSLFTANGVLFAQTRLALRGIGGIPHGYMLRFYHDWLKTQEYSYDQRKKAEGYSPSWLLDVPELYSRRAPGNTCLSSLRSMDKRYYPDDGSFISNPINHSKGCGGIMRVAPLGMAYERISFDTLDKEGAELAAITHGHSLGYMSAAVLVHIVHQIIYSQEQQPLIDIFINARDAVARLFADDEHLKELTDIIDLAIDLSENNDSDLNNIHKLGEGWVAEETLGIALYCSLKYKDDFSKAVTVAVNHSGDSDSTGAVTGNIVGALVGYDSIEDKWKNNLELSDIILELATDLCHGCQMSEFGSYRDDNWLSKYVR